MEERKALVALGIAICVAEIANKLDTTPEDLRARLLARGRKFPEAPAEAVALVVLADIAAGRGTP